MSKKTRPIIFRAEMINAILDGRKTQTRRVIKHQPECHYEYVAYNPIHAWSYYNGDPLNCDREGIGDCPHGSPGDVLWIRETWKFNTWTEDSEIAIKYRSDGESRWVDDVEQINEAVIMKEYNRACDECYASGVPFINERFDTSEYPDALKWRPAMYMYRWASRITLKIKRVCVERVQDISIEDICAEGLVSYLEEHDACCELKDMWITLWNSIHTKENTWDDNPYVWCIEFEVVK